MKSVLPAIVLVSAAPLLSGCVVVDSQAHIAREEKRFTVAGMPELHLTTFDGAIDIRSGDDAGTVIVEIEKRGPTQEAIEGLKIETKQDGNRIDIEVKRPAHEVVFFGIGHMTPSAKLIVTMPKTGNIVAKSGDGSIRVDGIRGRLELRTGDGAIRGIDIGGQMTLVTGDGSVTLSGTEGDLDVDTGDGSVSVAGKLATLKLNTGDGSVTFHADPGTTMKDDWSITTGDGGVSLYLPTDFGAELDAHTGDGRIRNELQISTVGGRDDSRRTLKGRLGSGGKLLRVRTGDGSIRLKTS
jgi:Putative adhesin